MDRTGIIVIDGPDASGKTTLANAIAKMYAPGVEIIHLTWNNTIKDVMFDYQTEALLEACDLSNQKLVILERFWVSENIYANVLRGGTPWPLMGRMMDRVLMKHAAINVLCVPSSVQLGVQMHNKNIDQAHPYEDDKFREIVSRYRRLYEGCRYHYKEEDYASWLTRQGGVLRAPRWDYSVYRMDFEGRYMDMYIPNLMALLEVRRRTQYIPALNEKDHNILGHLKHARYLFVGERTNNKGTKYDWPFYEYGNSSEYLARCLQALNYKEEWGMWTNLYNPDGTLTRHVVELRNKLKVIALGIDVGNKLADLGVPPNVMMHHPSWGARFHANDDTYIKELEVALA